FIRGYTSLQHQVRFGSALTQNQLTGVSNEIGRAVLQHVLDTGRFPSLKNIAKFDATNAVKAHFGGDAAAWSGNILFLGLGDRTGLDANLIEEVGDTYDLFTAAYCTALAGKRTHLPPTLKELLAGAFEGVHDNTITLLKSTPTIVKAALAVDKFLDDSYG